jgi:photosystem II stability/assembly factor-like uncharacterized protein
LIGLLWLLQQGEAKREAVIGAGAVVTRDTDEGYLYIGAGTGNFLKTTNGGSTWTISQIPGMYAVSKMQFIDSEIGWAMDEFYPFVKTTDGGQSWINMPVGGTEFFFVDRNNGWLARPIITDGPQEWTHLHHTTDGGAIWQDTVFNLGIIDITFANLDRGWFLANHNLVYRTTDVGVTWNHVYTFNEPVRRIEFTTGLDGWALGNEAIYSTTDGGATFSVSRYSNFYSVRELYFRSPSLGFAVGENGTILRYFHPTTGVRMDDQKTEDMPSMMVLDQNYPNPFNPITRIRFGLSVSGRTTLKVYDVLGREVATIADKQLSPGNYEATFDAAGLSSGLYFYRLESGNSVQTRKLLFLK